MSIEENKEIVRRWLIGIWCRGDLELMDELASEDFIHEEIGFGETSGAAFRDLVIYIRSAFPDISVDIEFQVAEGNIVVTRGTDRMTHQGPWLGIDPTGKSIAAPFVVITRFHDGLILKETEFFDTWGTLRQLGVVPPTFNE